LFVAPEDPPKYRWRQVSAGLLLPVRPSGNRTLLKSREGTLCEGVIWPERNRTLKMLPGFGDPALAGESGTGVVMNLGVVRDASEQGGVALDRLIQPSLVTQDVCEIHLREGVVRLDAERLEVMLLRPHHISAAAQGHCQVVVQLRIVRGEAETFGIAR